MATTVQTLIFSRDVFATADDARLWAREHGYRDDKVDETGDSWRLRQQDPDNFDDASFRTISLRDGVQAVIGTLREGRSASTSRSREAQDTSAVRAVTKPGSWDPATRTIDVVLSNERTNSVEYRSFFGDRWLETLSLQPENMRLDRINNGAPFLIMHRGRDERAQIGKFLEGSVRVEGTGDDRELVGTVLFSEHLDEEREAHVQEIADGIRRNVSVGFEDHAWFVIPGRDGEPDNIVIYDWEPYEGSSVTMGADDGAKFRAAPQQQRSPRPRATEGSMPQDDTQAPGLTEADVEERARELAEKLAGERLETAIDEHEARSAKIREAGKALGIDDETVDGWIKDRKITVEKARDLAFEAAASADEDADNRIRGSVTAGARDAHDLDGLRTVGALLLRDGRTEREIRSALKAVEPAKRYCLGGISDSQIDSYSFQRECRGEQRLTLAQIAERSIRAAGARPDDWSAGEIIQRALNLDPLRERSSGYNTQSTFPLLLAEVLNVSLKIGFLEVPVDLGWARRQPARDFRKIYTVTMGELDSLDEIGEGEEYQTSTMGESRDSYQIVKRGRIFGITWEAMINDHLGGLTQIPRKWGMSANRAVRNATYGLLLSNPTLESDSTALFDASRGNIAPVASSVSISAIDLMRTRMATRPGIRSTVVAPHMLRHLILAEGQRTLAKQVLGQVAVRPVATETTTADFVPDDFDFLVHSDPLIDAATFGGGALGRAWFGTDGESMAYSWLEGEEGPQVFAREGWKVDGMEWKVRLSFGAGFPEGWRGWDVNEGA